MEKVVIENIFSLLGAIIPFSIFIIGILISSLGLKRILQKRTIKNIPTTTIRSIAMGLVEIKGKAESKKILTSPLTKTQCVLFKYLIQYYKFSEESGWEKIISGNSFDSTFYINDGTGKVLVDPKDAEIFFPPNYVFSTISGKVKCGFGDSITYSINGFSVNPLPQNLKEFLRENGLTKYYDSQLLFREWTIKPNDTIYIIGTANKLDVFSQQVKKLKRDPEMIRKVDLDGNGIITTKEWNYAINEIKQKAYNELTQFAQTEHLADIVIGKGETEKIFIISNHSEKEVAENLLRESYIIICIGIFFILVGLFMLIKFLFEFSHSFL